MTRHGSLALLGLALLLLLGCRTEPRITRWHAGAEPAGSALGSCAPARAQITAFVTDPAPPAGQAPAIRDLPPGAQNTLLSKLADRTQTVDELLRVLAAPIGGTRALPGTPIDRTRVRRRIVFAVEKGALSIPPADRLNKVLATIDIMGAGRIRSWNRFETEWGNVDLGTLTFDQRLTSKASVSAGAGDLLPISLTPQVGAESEEKLREELALSRRFVALTGTLEPGGRRARLYQEGSPRVDLTGNFFVEVELELEAAPAFNAFTFETGRPDEQDLSRSVARAPEEISFVRAPVYLPVSREAVWASIGGEYLMRRVYGGETTIMEGDDHVSRFVGRFSSCEIELITQRELQALRSHWQLVIGEPVVDPAIHLARRKGAGRISKVETITFADYREAEAFQSWMLDQAAAPQGRTEVRVGRHHVLVYPMADEQAEEQAFAADVEILRYSDADVPFRVLTPAECFNVAIEILGQDERPHER